MFWRFLPLSLGWRLMGSGPRKRKVLLKCDPLKSLHPGLRKELWPAGCLLNRRMRRWWKRTSLPRGEQGQCRGNRNQGLMSSSSWLPSRGLPCPGWLWWMIMKQPLSAPSSIGSTGGEARQMLASGRANGWRWVTQSVISRWPASRRTESFLQKGPRSMKSFCMTRINRRGKYR